MLKPEALELIKQSAREFDVRAIYLFGSALEDEGSARDIDLAVDGIKPNRFFDFYARLFFGLPKPVDLIDLAKDLPIVGLIRQTGTPIFER